MSERIRAKVAEILNARELVITAGSDNGVLQGMKFAVLNSRGVDIKDPDTGEVIGSVDIPKVFIEAARVMPQLTVARTFRKEEKNIGGIGAGGLAFFQPPKYVQVPETLKLSEKPYEEELSEQESYVKRGDPVVQIIGKEYDLE